MKIMRSYKLSPVCLKQGAWLQKRVGLDSFTAVIEHAVSELFYRKQSEYRQYLVPRGENFNLMIGDVPVAEVSPELANALPKDFLARKETERGSILAMLYLTLASGNKGTMVVDHDALASVWRSRSPQEG